jgi:hypothetical protein
MNGPRLFDMHHELNDVNLDYYKSTVVYASVSLAKVTELVP